MAYPEEDTPADSIQSPEQLKRYGLRDWADVIIDELGTDHSNDERLLQDARWWSSDDQAYYELQRHDTYDEAGASPQRTYHLKAYTAGNGRNFTGYFYTTTDRFASKRDMRWGKVSDGQKPRVHHQEMIDHLRTASVEPHASFASPRVIRAILREVAAQDFSRRSRMARRLGAFFGRRD